MASRSFPLLADIPAVDIGPKSRQLLSPPVAMSAYYLKAVVPDWDLSTIYKGVADFMVLQVTALLLLMIFPEIAL
jgi:TRAP-type mannitol/chloroaromatic compound transport system permease large subunit